MKSFLGVLMPIINVCKNILTDGMRKKEKTCVDDGLRWLWSSPGTFHGGFKFGARNSHIINSDACYMFTCISFGLYRLSGVFIEFIGMVIEKVRSVRWF